MRWDQRLWARLALAFAAVTLVTVGIVAVLMSANTDTQFRQYLMRRDMVAQTGLIDSLADYYQQTGNWSGVGRLLGESDGMGTGGMGRGRGGMGEMGSGMGGHTTYLLADTQQRIVYDERSERSGQAFTVEESTAALPITDQRGQTIGYLVILTGRGMLPDDQSFLIQTQQTLLISGFLAAAIGAGIGVLISRGFSAPLGALARAAKAFAVKDWSKRVQVQGSGEIAQVGRAFNAMADDLQHAEKLRQDMIADIAHELRTPLSVIQGNLRAILDGMYPLEMTEIATLFDQTRLLNRLVGDLRELALADAGQLQLKLVEVDPLELVRITALHFRGAAEARGIDLRLELPAALPRVRVDQDRLAQALNNLLSNALRHTAQGSITLQVALESDRTRMRISVLDTGEGIPPEDLPHLFERFYRGDKSRVRSAGGSGLGLAIARSLIEAMGGVIGAENRLNGGAVFWLTVPVVK